MLVQLSASNIDRHASELGISTCSLINHWKRADPVLKLKSHGASLLSDDQELILLYAAQAFSAANEDLIPSQIKTIARELWKVELKSSWISNWLQRHKKDISFRRWFGLKKNRPDVERREPVRPSLKIWPIFCQPNASTK